MSLSGGLTRLTWRFFNVPEIKGDVYIMDHEVISCSHVPVRALVGC